MARVKRAVNAQKKRRSVLKASKGYRGQRSRLYRKAKEQQLHSLTYAYRDRRARKGEFRKLWIARINAAARANDITYNRFIQGLKAAGVEVDRKVLADIAVTDPAAFTALVEVARKYLEHERETLERVTAARAQAMAVLEETGLADRAHLPASQLNLAGRKRLEIARALATGPRVLLLDEVLAGLNATEVEGALDLIREVRERHKLSIIIIEHVMKALMRLSDRIVVLHEGRKVVEGLPAEVANDPRVIKAYLGEQRHAHPA